MKRYSMAVVFGLTVMLLAMAPQLRADATDKFNYDGEHNNTLFATSYDKDGDPGPSWWADDDKDNDHDWHHHWHVWDHDSGNGNFGGGTGDCDCGAGTAGTQSTSGSTTNVSTPEPSTLLLLLSGFLAAGLGLALKKAAV